MVVLGDRYHFEPITFKYVCGHCGSWRGWDGGKGKEWLGKRLIGASLPVVVECSVIVCKCLDS